MFSKNKMLNEISYFLIIIPTILATTILLIL